MPSNAERDQSIWRRHLAGEQQKKLAAEFGVTPSRIRDICRSQQFIADNPQASEWPNKKIHREALKQHRNLKQP